MKTQQWTKQEQRFITLMHHVGQWYAQGYGRHQRPTKKQPITLLSLYRDTRYWTRSYMRDPNHRTWALSTFSTEVLCNVLTDCPDCCDCEKQDYIIAHRHVLPDFRQLRQYAVWNTAYGPYWELPYMVSCKCDVCNP